MLETIKKLVGRRVRFFRKRAGFSSAESLAEAIGVHPNSVGDLERGDNWVSPEMLHKLVIALRVPMDAFFTETPIQIEPTPKEALEVLTKFVKENSQK